MHQSEIPLSGTVKQEFDKERHFQNENYLAMQQQIKSLEEKNRKLFSDNRKLSSEVRRVKARIEHVRARDNRHQIQLQEYSKLLNESKAQIIKLENVIKNEVDGETIPPQVKAEIGYDDLCAQIHSDESNSDDLKEISKALSAAFTGSEAYSRAAYSRAESLCHSSILNGYLSDASEQ